MNRAARILCAVRNIPRCFLFSGDVGDAREAGLKSYLTMSLSPTNSSYRWRAGEKRRNEEQTPIITITYGQFRCYHVFISSRES